MEGGDDRHLEAPEESQNVAARRTAKNSILVLQAYQVEIREMSTRSLAVNQERAKTLHCNRLQRIHSRTAVTDL
jgi:hypothetical protein